MKTFPKYLGMWIWQVSQCENGDWNKIISKCQLAGVRWLAIKSGDANRNKQLNTDNLKKILDLCHNNGILVYSWNYSKPTTWKEEIVQIKSLFDDGIDGHIIDAESEWQTAQGNRKTAEQFLSELRKQIGDVFLAHSPFPIVEYHSIFPYTEFGKYCDAVMPQSYWTEINWSFQKTMDKTDASWVAFNDKHANAAKPVFPIGVTYGKGYPRVLGELKVEDIVAFVNRYPEVPISFYSYDASKNFKFVWDALIELEGIRKKLPEPPLPPIIIDLDKADPVIDPLADAPLPIPSTFWSNVASFISKIFGIK
jgi:hypothetical protein